MHGRGLSFKPVSVRNFMTCSQLPRSILLAFADDLVLLWIAGCATPRMKDENCYDSERLKTRLLTRTTKLQEMPDRRFPRGD